MNLLHRTSLAVTGSIADPPSLSPNARRPTTRFSIAHQYPTSSRLNSPPPPQENAFSSTNALIEEFFREMEQYNIMSENSATAPAAADTDSSKTSASADSRKPSPTFISSTFPNYYQIQYQYPSKRKEKFSYSLQMFDRECSVRDPILEELPLGLQENHPTKYTFTKHSAKSTSGNASMQASGTDTSSHSQGASRISINSFVRRLLLPGQVRRVKVPEYKLSSEKSSPSDATQNQGDSESSVTQPYSSPEWFDQFPVLLYFGALWDKKAKGLTQNIHGIFCKEDEGYEYRLSQSEVKRKFMQKYSELNRLRTLVSNELEHLHKRADESLSNLTATNRRRTYHFTSSHTSHSLSKRLEVEKLSGSVLGSMNTEKRKLVEDIKLRERFLAQLPEFLSLLEKEEMEYNLKCEQRKTISLKGTRGNQRFLQHIAVYIPLDNEEDAYQEFIDQLKSGFDIGGRALAWYTLKYSQSSERDSLTRQLMRLFRVSQVPHLVYLHPNDDLFGSLPMCAFTQDLIQRKIYHAFAQTQSVENPNGTGADLNGTKTDRQSKQQNGDSLSGETKYQLEMLRTLGEVRDIKMRFETMGTSNGSSKKSQLESFVEGVNSRWSKASISENGEAEIPSLSSKMQMFQTQFRKVVHDG